MSDAYAELDALLDGPAPTPVVEPHVLENVLLDRFTTDIARRIFPPDEIARRYGMTGKKLIEAVSIPAVNKIVRTKRAVWESDTNATERIRQLSQIGMLEVMPDVFELISNPETPTALRLDALKTMSRVAGVDGPGAQPRQGDVAAAPGTRFEVNIHLGGGRIETITSTAPEIEHEPAT